MAKKTRKIFALCLALALCVSAMGATVYAKGGDNKHGPGGGNESGTEYVGIQINGGDIVIIDSGNSHNWLTNGTYSDVEATVTGSNTIEVTVNTSNGKQTYEGTLAKGYEFSQTGQVSSENISGTNSRDSRYDNIVIKIDATSTETDPDATEPTGPIIDFEPKPTEPDPTEPDPTEPEPTEPEPTEPEPTEPAPTEPEPTEPAPTEPDPTEPDPTEPEPTEPEPTEPEPTEPAPTEPDPTEPDPTEPEPTDPPAPPAPPTPPAPPAPPAPLAPPAVVNDAGGEIDIFDEDVPLAEAPETGDISALWIALSGASAGGMILLGRKREEDDV